MSIEVVKIPISKLVWMFVIYLILHIVIGIIAKRRKDDLNEEPRNENLKNEVRFWNIAFKWFPAAIVVLYVLMLM